MSEMVERVARAIHASMRYGSRKDQETCEECERAARAAIAAMREPTPAMQVAANDIAHKEYGGEMSEPRPLDLWRVMIDAALSDDPR